MACKARQYSDQMICGECGLSWDTNDPEPPECRRDVAGEPRIIQIRDPKPFALTFTRADGAPVLKVWHGEQLRFEVLPGSNFDEASKCFINGCALILGMDMPFPEADDPRQMKLELPDAED